MANQTPTKVKPQKVKPQKVKRNRLKEMGSELKKVSYPSFRKTMKQTGVVISVVLFFTLIIMGLDWILSKLYNILVSGI